MARLLALRFWIGVMQMAPAQSVSVTPSGVPGVEVVGSPSPAYQIATDQFFGPARSANLIDWLPFGMVVTNRTTQTIVAIAIRWQLTYGEAQTLHADLVHQAFDQPREQLAPGKTAVAVPQTLLFDGSRLPAAFQVTPPPGYVPGPGKLQNLQRFRAAQSVQVTLDGVVFASGQFVGPDTGKEYEQYVANLTVPAAIAAKVLAMKAVGETVVNVVAWLQTAETQPVNLKDDGWWNASVGAHTARQLLRSYQHGGEVLLYEAAQGYPQAPIIRLYR